MEDNYFSAKEVRCKNIQIKRDKKENIFKKFKKIAAQENVKAPIVSFRKSQIESEDYEESIEKGKNVFNTRAVYKRMNSSDRKDKNCNFTKANANVIGTRIANKQLNTQIVRAFTKR